VARVRVVLPAGGRGMRMVRRAGCLLLVVVLVVLHTPYL
jgi:hypothetical protein